MESRSQIRPYVQRTVQAFDVDIVKDAVLAAFFLLSHLKTRLEHLSKQVAEPLAGGLSQCVAMCNNVLTMEQTALARLESDASHMGGLLSTLHHTLRQQLELPIYLEQEAENVEVVVVPEDNLHVALQAALECLDHELEDALVTASGGKDEYFLHLLHGGLLGLPPDIRRVEDAFQAAMYLVDSLRQYRLGLSLVTSTAERPASFAQEKELEELT